jgi:hypothetical protein
MHFTAQNQPILSTAMSYENKRIQLTLPTAGIK